MDDWIGTKINELHIGRDFDTTDISEWDIGNSEYDELLRHAIFKEHLIRYDLLRMKRFKNGENFLIGEELTDIDNTMVKYRNISFALWLGFLLVHISLLVWIYSFLNKSMVFFYLLFMFVFLYLSEKIPNWLMNKKISKYKNRDDFEFFQDWIKNPA